MSLPVKGAIYDGLTGYHHQSPLSDMRRPPCADFEINLAECLEAYGLKKGYDVCYKYVEDFRECRSKEIQRIKSIYVRYTWAKKVATGEIPWDRRKAEPVPYDSYIAGSFYP